MRGDVLHFVRRRIIHSIPVVIGVVTLVFLLIHIVPGDPIEMMLGDSAQSVDKENLRRLLGLDLPLWKQYIEFWRKLVFEHGGLSFTYERPVFELLWSRFWMSLSLALPSLALASLISFPLGVYSARRAGRVGDFLGQGFALLGMSIPLFVVAPLAVLVFSIDLRWLPVAGSETPAHLVLPVLCLSIGLSGLLTRMVRSSMLENLGEDYVRTARAKGLSERRILYVHALRNALIPVVTILANMLGGLLAGAVITETLFDWPGLGKLFFAAFQSRDFPLLQGVVLWIALSYVVLHLFVDILYSILDPRIRLEKST